MVTATLVKSEPTTITPQEANFTFIATRRTDAAALVSAFLSGRNERTIRAYRQDLEGFRSFVGSGTLDDAARLLLSRGNGEANGLALAYKSDLIQKGLQATTINRRLAALRSLVKLASTLGIVQWRLEVENLKAEKYRDTRGPGREGVRSLLLKLENRNDRKGIRDRAILRLLHGLGLRRGEIVSLDVDDVDTNAGTIAVLGKGQTQKLNLTLPDKTKLAVQAWLDVRGPEPGALFTNLIHGGTGKGNRITGTGLYLVIRELGDKAGVRVRPHGVRHEAITTALDLTNGNVRAVQRFSRHKDVRTLYAYDDNRTDLAGDVASLVAASV